jgi:nucleotide-binding universal stress UspA family protein
VAPVLVALQGSPRDDAAVDYEAVAWARKAGSELVAVRVVPLSDPRVSRQLGPMSYLGTQRLLPATDDGRLEAAARLARSAGVEVRTELLASSDSAKAIAHAAKRHHASVVFVEPPGDGRRARLRCHRLARRIKRLAGTPVFVVRGRPGSEPR